MPHAAIFAGLAIQAGALMIQAGMQRVIPEIAKALDEPELEEAIKNLQVDKIITRTLVDVTRRKNLR